jgi:hypothetical protein
MDTQTPVTFKDSLKSWDTENWLDRKFYRPVGFQIALLLRSTPITPNAITIISIFVGMGGVMLFYPANITINLLGFSLLVFANILDCVDGQLARITGIKSKIGRILDGFCGDIWFLTFYITICLRLINGDDGISSSFLDIKWEWWVFFIALASAYSHFNQAALIDYYKTLHLHFLKGGKNSEFENSLSVKENYNAISWKKEPASKIFLKLYHIYTLNQERKTPELQLYIKRLQKDYPDGYPQERIDEFREKSLKMMPLLDSFTFNARSIVMLLSLLLNVVWLYFLCEILVLNPLLSFAIHRHEKMCHRLNQQ